MSSSATPDPDAGLGRRRTIGKYVKRMSSVFRKGNASQGSVPTTSTAATTTTSAPKPATEPSAKTTTTPAPATTATPTSQYNRSALQQERARALFAKYGLTLESHEWITAPVNATNVQRVEKPIRMRVHRSCHRCGTTFGPDKLCSKCEHKRCKKCPRYPKKKTPGEKGKDAVESRPKRKPQLTIKSKTGGELVYQPVRQRIRRTCHKCETYFNPPTATVCEICQHTRCTKCPRDPPKLKKWPDGYPGDAAPESDTDAEPGRVERKYRKPRVRVRWECERCQTIFKDGSPQCASCGHDRCDRCTRKPPKKVKQERVFDPDVVKRVEEKLAEIRIGETPTATVTAA
ncbi:hypothetical protein K432DRAFT_133131 [Lepidopterella palustris CBS 459.81]|uniref:Uncharacterized protein n=1 Tax=Lepidopterella palustris CBS 459.81 TaxID=1314670 RepID=A0A8E2JBW1_9PEZI|nr:hypothetical protein K432DRAFT_133131 [Lepidopterella palustris CBS 459.81]